MKLPTLPKQILNKADLTAWSVSVGAIIMEMYGQSIVCIKYDTQDELITDMIENVPLGILTNVLFISSVVTAKYQLDHNNNNVYLLAIARVASMPFMNDSPISMN